MQGNAATDDTWTEHVMTGVDQSSPDIERLHAAAAWLSTTDAEEPALPREWTRARCWVAVMGRVTPDLFADLVGVRDLGAYGSFIIRAEGMIRDEVRRTVGDKDRHTAAALQSLTEDVLVRRVAEEFVSLEGNPGNWHKTRVWAALYGGPVSQFTQEVPEGDPMEHAVAQHVEEAMGDLFSEAQRDAACNAMLSCIMSVGGRRKGVRNGAASACTSRLSPLRVPDDLRTRLQAAAQRLGLDVATLRRRLLEEGLDRLE